MLMSQISVGNKRFIEVNADPMLSGVDAPIGSVAVFDDNGVGKIYLKIGATSTSWVYFQLGAETSGWNFATTLAGLNVAGEDRYFGTNADSTDNKIVFNRRGVPYFDLGVNGKINTQTSMHFNANNDRYVEVNEQKIEWVKETYGMQMLFSGSYFQMLYSSTGSNSPYINMSNAEMTIDSSGGLTTTQGRIVRDVVEGANSYYMQLHQNTSSFSTDVRQRHANANATLTNINTEYTVNRQQTYNTSKIVRSVMTIGIFGKVGGVDSVVMMKKEIISSGNQILEILDPVSYQSDDALVANLSVSVDFVSGANLNFIIRVKTLEAGEEMTEASVFTMLEDNHLF